MRQEICPKTLEDIARQNEIIPELWLSKTRGIILIFYASCLRKRCIFQKVHRPIKKYFWLAFPCTWKAYGIRKLSKQQKRPVLGFLSAILKISEDSKDQDSHNTSAFFSYSFIYWEIPLTLLVNISINILWYKKKRFSKFKQYPFQVYWLYG